MNSGEKIVRRKAKRDELDFYPTPEWATRALLNREKFEGVICEPACGNGAMSKVLESYGYQVISSDIVDRGYGVTQNFFDHYRSVENIVTNPPFNLAKEFILHAKECATRKIAIFFRIQFLSSRGRYDLFADAGFPLQTVYVFSPRVTLWKNGVVGRGGGTADYIWVVFNREYRLLPVLRWINPAERKERC